MWSSIGNNNNNKKDELVGSCKGIAVAVVDANAIIEGGLSLSNSSHRLVSVPEVIHEIRDANSRHTLNLRLTGTLSDVDLKLIALTYALEAEYHGTQHLRDKPPPLHTVNVPQKDLPGWGSNVPNLQHWEALENANHHASNPNSRILPLTDFIPQHPQSVGDKYMPKKKEVKTEGKMVADGIDASKGQFNDDAADWLPAVSRSTHRRFLRRKSRCQMNKVSNEIDNQQGQSEKMEVECDDEIRFPELLNYSSHKDDADEVMKENNTVEPKTGAEDISAILSQMRLEEESINIAQNDKASNSLCGENDFYVSEDDAAADNNSEELDREKDVSSIPTQELANHDVASEISESANASHDDDNSSEHSWMLRSLSDSSIACITGDFAMQNVLLQMGLRLLAPGGMQIRELHRWVLKCHACFKVTTDVGKIFCPNCGNGGTLRKVAVTVGENGIVLAARRPRVSLRGTKFSLPLPQGGRDAITKNPILREDQLPQKYLHPRTKKKNKQEDDIFASNDLFIHHTDKRAPLQPPVRKALAVFSGRRNPNDNHYSRAQK
ncbi:hypothetical protein LIER_03095 [Lithospermum erythrorhizon]|uniref:RNA-binding protein NOB1 n=1 Tax=Lithospermum erythrorhizon TaxID=34254 RepID=A0AAV3NSG3_LITER